MKPIYFLLLVLLPFGCKNKSRNELIYIYPKNKTEVITILSNYNKNERIIAVGKHTSIPEDNFVKLDISKITDLEDEIGVCWQEEGSWKLVNDKAKVLKNELNKKKYEFLDSWEENDDGIPNAKYYRKDGCFTFGTLNYGSLYPEEHGHIERID